MLLCRLCVENHSINGMVYQEPFFHVARVQIDGKEAVLTFFLIVLTMGVHNATHVRSRSDAFHYPSGYQRKDLHTGAGCIMPPKAPLPQLFFLPEVQR